VTVIFWSLIIPFKKDFSYEFPHWCAAIIQHSIHFVCISIDWFLITIPTNFKHFIPMLVVGILYLIYAHIYHLIFK